MRSIVLHSLTLNGSRGRQQTLMSSRAGVATRILKRLSPTDNDGMARSHGLPRGSRSSETEAWGEKGTEGERVIADEAGRTLACPSKCSRSCMFLNSVCREWATRIGTFAKAVKEQPSVQACPTPGRHF
uniref:Uncharacterized protein n=1 Tax=Rousettus aegyptiacus TaxID=9407 RepID=A0A7J8FJ50_ROUAE|nr:hypothetical protein HJG63_011920 [Rousettus aegyptiacus]